jgi:hypothetical protein
MEDIVSYLKGRKIDRAFAELGLDFDGLFSGRSAGEGANPYDRYEWIVKKVPRFNTVINAVPPDDRLGDLPWEEWYRIGKAVHHHVLFLNQPNRWDEIFDAPEIDEIHPPRTLGKKWYVLDDSDMSPTLLRGGT